MSDDLVRVAPSDALRPAGAQRAELVLPRLIVDAGPVAMARFLEFFAARIANRRTRAAYGRAVGQFLAWCEARVWCAASVQNTSSNGTPQLRAIVVRVLLSVSKHARTPR